MRGDKVFAGVVCMEKLRWISAQAETGLHGSMEAISPDQFCFCSCHLPHQNCLYLSPSKHPSSSGNFSHHHHSLGLCRTSATCTAYGSNFTTPDTSDIRIYALVSFARSPESLARYVYPFYSMQIPSGGLDGSDEGHVWIPIHLNFSAPAPRIACRPQVLGRSSVINAPMKYALNKHRNLSGCIARTPPTRYLWCRNTRSPA